MKAGSASPASKTTAERYEAVRATSLAAGPPAPLSAREMREELGVSESGHHSYRRRKEEGPSPREARDIRDFALVKRVYDYRGRTC